MNKFIRLLLSFLSVLLFFSCANNLKSSSLVISFNLQNQNNQNIQRASTPSENLNVTVIMYDVENLEDQIGNISNFKIIQQQTVPVINKSARITFNDVTVGTKSIIKAQITHEYKILYEGQSQFFVVSEGKNSITINLSPYYGDPGIPPENTQDPKDLSYKDNFLEIYTEEGLKTFRNIVNNSFTEEIIVDDIVFYPDASTNQSVNARLCSDISLTEPNWEPIGYYKNDNDNKAYNGIFDGDGKCVTNLKNSNPTSSIGFFGYIETAIIKNLYVSGEINCNSSYNIGGIVGYAKSSGQNYSSISNCINNVSIKNENSSIEVGGILGCSSGAVDINSCVNIAEITNGYSVAGILGYGSSNVTISKCLNLGSITMNGTYNAVAGIANIYGDQNNPSSVTNCINASSIQGEDEDDYICPIVYSATSDSYATLLFNYYDSTILPTVTAVDGVIGKPSSELDGLPLDGWYNGEESDSRYPIPTAIKEAFNESSYWYTLSNAVSIPENNTPEATPDYVSGAYFVNGDTGDDDNNDGLSVEKPYKKLTTAITKAIDSDARTVYVSGTLTPSNQGVTNPSNNQNIDSAIFYIKFNENPFSDNQFIEIIGEGEDVIFDAQNKSRVLSTWDSYNFKIKNIQFLNGNTTGSGAAIFFYKGNLELDSCKISGNSSTDSVNGNAYNGIYTYGGGSVLKMTNTTCENSIYLSSTEATIGSNCTIGTASPEATDGFITLDVSTLILYGENIFIHKPIYVKSLSSSIKISDNYSHEKPITIKLSSSLTEIIKDGTVYTLVSNCDETKSNYFTIECEDSTKTATLGADGTITVN